MTERKTTGTVLLEERAGVRRDRALIQGHAHAHPEERGGSGRWRPPGRADDAADGLADVGSDAVTSIRWMR